MAKDCWVVSILEFLCVRNPKNSQAICTFQIGQRRGRLAHDDNSRDFTGLELFDCVGVSEVQFLHLDAKRVGPIAQ